MYKYLIPFPVPDPFKGRICELQDAVATITNISPPYWRLAPHVTFHRPLTGISENVLKNIVGSAVLQMRQTRITLHALYPFGKHYIVLPVQATRAVASLWVEINNLLRRLPEYEHGEYDDDNTLHVTIAEKTTPVFDRAWPAVRKIPFEPITVPLRSVALWRKSAEGGAWETVEAFNIPA